MLESKFAIAIKSLKIVDGRTTYGRMAEHGYTISSPCELDACELDGSGELKTSRKHLNWCSTGNTV